MARNDIHAPSVIVPADYKFVAFQLPAWRYGYHTGATAVWLNEWNTLGNHMRDTGGAWSDHKHGGSCHVCGAHAVYLAVFYHARTNTYIRTGMDCAEKMQMGDPARFRRLRDAVEAAKKARAGWTKAEGVLLREGLENVWQVFTACQKPGKESLEGALRQAGMQGDDLARLALRDLWLEQGLDPDAQPVAWGKEETIIVDIVGKLARYGSATAKQLNFLAKLAKDIADRPVAVAKKAELDAKRAEEKAATPDAPTGRVTFTGVVIKTEYKEYGGGGRYGAPDGRNVCTIKTEEGWLAWGTVPRACEGLKKGDTVEITAAVKPSDKDPKFAFYTRPSGRIVEAAPMVEANQD